jgi:two-component system, OmpR family, sensor histidine kinase CiaH
MVKGNPDQLKQVLTILIDNAIKYGKAGVKVSVSVTKGVSAAKLEVADTGPGIEAKELRTIFRRFYRGQKTKSLARGAGLGLAVAKKIVEAHEGHIRVKSEVGKGHHVYGDVATLRIFLRWMGYNKYRLTNFWTAPLTKALFFVSGYGSAILGL